MHLTDAQKREIYERGFVNIPAVNLSANVRYAIFFRLRHIEHDAHKWDVMKNIWLQWEGMRDVIGGCA